MLEAEWLVCPDPTAMLEHLDGLATNRKLQLFACGCCRRLLGLFPNAAIRAAVEFGELDADQGATPQDLLEAQQSVSSWLDAESTQHSATSNTQAETSAVQTARGLTQRTPIGRGSLARYTARDSAKAVRDAANDRRAIREAEPGNVIQVARATWQAAEEAYTAERKAQADLLRDIIGNPFRFVDFDAEWRRPEVFVFAERIYERQEFERLTEMADLLEDVGCTEPSVLAHCREPSQHVRGCWVLDLLLELSQM